MEQPKQSRKACDLCYQRKIKCDSKKPRCSNCTVYDASCTYVAASRKTKPKKQAAFDAKTRIEDLESKLEQVLDKVQHLEKAAKDASSSQEPVSTPQNETQSLRSDLNVRVGEMELPAMDETLSLVERYLSTTNSLLPLFHDRTLLHTVRFWYQNPRLRDPTTWALINVILALAHCLGVSAESNQANGSTSKYLQNVQSVLTELISGETELTTVQILVGMAMLFQATNNLKPATIMTSTALHLAHILQLHVEYGSKVDDPIVVTQRRRVFWMLYILDRELSMRTGLPPVQRDTDIALDLPPVEVEEEEEDQAGFVIVDDGQTKFNYFRARVELAFVQGKVHDHVFSVSGQSSSLEDRAAARADMIRMLDVWYAQIPSVFQADTLAHADSFHLSRPFCILYSNNLLSRFLISQASSWDSNWVGRLQDYGRNIATGKTDQVAPVPQGWRSIMQEARRFMTLFMTVSVKDTSFIWLTACPYISSMVCLIAQSIFNPNDELVESDRLMIDSALVLLDEMVQQTGLESLRTIWDACGQLKAYAQIIAQPQLRGELEDPYSSIPGTNL